MSGKKTPVDEIVLIPKIAPLLALGRSTSDIAATLKIGFNTVRRIVQKDDCKQAVREITDSYRDIAKAYCAKAIAEMNELSMEGLKKALKEGNVQAIRTHLQVIGLLGAEESNKQQQGAGTIQVILPGAHAEKPAIETEFSFEPPEVSSGEQEVDLGPGEA